MKNDLLNFSLRVYDSGGRLIQSNMSKEDIALYEQDKVGASVKKTHRSGEIKVGGYQVQVVTKDRSLVNSSKTFKAFLRNLGSLIDVFLLERAKAEETGRQDLRRLIHNLETYNAQGMQEASVFAPQLLMADMAWAARDEYIQQQIAKNIPGVSRGILKMARINQGIRTELSVFKKLEQANPELKIQNHSIHRMLMNMLYLFFPDFNEKAVYVKVASCAFEVRVDYESISVAMYHILQNAAKYCISGQDIEVEFSIASGSVAMSLSMISLRVEDDELENIFNASCSGVHAVRANMNGSGMGMSLVKRIAELNKGAISFKPQRANQIEFNSAVFESNIIELSLPSR